MPGQEFCVEKETVSGVNPEQQFVFSPQGKIDEKEGNLKFLRHINYAVSLTHDIIKIMSKELPSLNYRGLNSWINQNGMNFTNFFATSTKDFTLGEHLKEDLSAHALIPATLNSTLEFYSSSDKNFYVLPLKKKDQQDNEPCGFVIISKTKNIFTGSWIIAGTGLGSLNILGFGYVNDKEETGTEAPKASCLCQKTKLHVSVNRCDYADR